MTTPAAAYAGPHLWQGGTTPCAWQNCNCTTHVVLKDIDWLGAKPGTLAEVGTVRKWIESRYAIACAGTSLPQNEAALVSLYGTSMTHKWDIVPSTIRSFLLGGYKVAGVEGYGPWHGTPWDYSPNFSGGHAIAYKGARDNTALATPRWEWRRDDPLNKTADQWVPESIAIKALQVLFADHNCEYSITRCLAASAPKKVLYAGGVLRAAAKVASVDKGTLVLGSLLSHTGTVVGGAWTVNGKNGNVWLKVTAVNGAAFSAYVALGWVTGPGGAA